MNNRLDVGLILLATLSLGGILLWLQGLRRPWSGLKRPSNTRTSFLCQATRSLVKWTWIFSTQHPWPFHEPTHVLQHGHFCPTQDSRMVSTSWLLLLSGRSSEKAKSVSCWAPFLCNRVIGVNNNVSVSSTFGELHSRAMFHACSSLSFFKLWQKRQANSKLVHPQCDVRSLNAGASDWVDLFENKLFCTTRREMHKSFLAERDLFVDFCTRDLLVSSRIVRGPSCRLMMLAATSGNWWCAVAAQMFCEHCWGCLDRNFYRFIGQLRLHRFRRRLSCHGRSAFCALQHGALDFGRSAGVSTICWKKKRRETAEVQFTCVPPAIESLAAISRATARTPKCLCVRTPSGC